MALIWIRATSRLARYYLALVSIKGFTCLMPMDLSGLLRRLLTDSHIYFALKVLLAILGLLAFTLATGNIQLTVLLSLGVVAGAIAETDDSLWGRLKNLAMTLICFMFASLCVQYLYPTPGCLPSGWQVPPLSS